MLSPVELVRISSPIPGRSEALLTEFVFPFISYFLPPCTLRRLAAPGILTPINGQLLRPRTANDKEERHLPSSHPQCAFRRRHYSIRSHARWILLPLVSLVVLAVSLHTDDVHSKLVLHSLRIFSKSDSNTGEEWWHAGVAGGISGLAIAAEKPSRRITIGQQLLVRGLQGQFNVAKSKGYSIPHGSVLLFGAACGQIMYSWLVSLPFPLFCVSNLTESSHARRWPPKRYRLDTEDGSRMPLESPRRVSPSISPLIEPESLIRKL